MHYLLTLLNYKMTDTLWSICYSIKTNITKLTLESSLLIFSVGIFHVVSRVFSRHGHLAYVVAKLNPGVWDAI